MEEDKPEYLYRLTHLVVDLGTEVLLQIFKHKINVSNKVSFERFLKSKESEIKRLEERKLLNKKQLETLNQTNFDETKLDISLLYTLLRNLTDIQKPNTGWNARLLSSDRSPGALLTRLKNVRNEAIAHKTKASLKKSEFEEFWIEASSCLVELAGGISSDERLAVQKKVDHCKTQPLLGGENEKPKLDALRKWDLEETCSELESEVDTLTGKVSEGGGNTEDLMPIFKKILEIRKALSIREGSTGTSSLVKPSPSTSAGSELDIQDEQLKQRYEQIQRQLDQLISQKMYNPHQTPHNMGQQVGHQQAWPFIGLGAGYDHTTPYPDNPHNMCRGGVGGEMDGSSSSHYKKTKDDTLSQSVIDTLYECMKRVGCLIVPSLGGIRGTVFRAGDRYVITTSHLLDSITDNMYGESLPWNDRIPAVYIDFNENPTSPTRKFYTVKPPCFIDRQLDVAILVISNPDNSLPGCLTLSKTDELRLSVSCICYGHPGSYDKHVDPKCCVLTVNSRRVQDSLNAHAEAKDTIELGLKMNGHNQERVKEAFKGYDDPSCFLLSSFLEHGGSGGPAIDHSNSYSPVVVGIYTRGFPSTLFGLPDIMRLNYNKEFRFEMCIKTSSLYTKLVSQDQELARNIFG